MILYQGKVYNWFSDVFGIFISLHLYNQSTVLSKGVHLIVTFWWTERGTHSKPSSGSVRGPQSLTFSETERSDDQMPEIWNSTEKPEEFGKDRRITILVEDLQVTSSSDILHFYIVHSYLMYLYAVVCSGQIGSFHSIKLHSAFSKVSPVSTGCDSFPVRSQQVSWFWLTTKNPSLFWDRFSYFSLFFDSSWLWPADFRTLFKIRKARLQSSRAAAESPGPREAMPRNRILDQIDQRWKV